MDWSNEIKVLKKALKEYKKDKSRLEADMAKDTVKGTRTMSYFIVQKELLIQNIESRIKMAEEKLAEEKLAEKKKKI